MGREAPFWGKKKYQTKTKRTRQGCVPLEGFGSIQSKDLPYFRGKDIYSLGVNARMKTCLPLPLFAGII